jgi:cell division protein FtsB
MEQTAKEKKENAMRMQKLLIAVLVLQVLTVLNQWFGSPVSTAQAQIPDAGAQRDQVIDELKTNNDLLKGIDDKLDKMLSIFQSGKVQVELSKPDDNQEK